MGLLNLISVTAGRLTTDRFVSLSVGSTLVLKACGFIEDHQAKILEVSETLLRVRTGSLWYEGLFAFGNKPLEICLSINPLNKEEEPNHQRFNRPSNSYCTIDVAIRSSSPRWSQEEFERESKRMLWTLRAYFMAC
ncbi:hypothetical protein SH661x_004691 [Planctomicrobium sp. SH661]|uniref:hypothetical protein n=1 Tax=Planctomicrobium sp. SH661 TaxID=3448124 RepID=UPI003F5CA61C